MDNRHDLKDVTLVTVTSVEIDSAANALLVSSEFCKFAAIKLLSPNKPIALHQSIEHVSIPPMDFYGYSKFMIEKLNQFVDTKFCLVIQSDGFIINPQMWRNEFLEYDYIGAPWPEIVTINNADFNEFSFNKNRVGNGGFSLRSKKLLEICSNLKFDELHFPMQSEDMIICDFLYEDMCKAGIQFAPLDIASQFSIESLIDHFPDKLSSSFGFHGKRWLSDPFLAKLAEESIYKKEFESLLVKNLTVTLMNQPNRIGRLDPCPCGSTRRYKDCHGKVS